MARSGALTVLQCRTCTWPGDKMSVLAKATYCPTGVNYPILEDTEHSTLKGLIKTLINQLNQIYEQELPCW